MLHGFTQNRDCLGPLADALARQRRVIRPDLPGHGSSGAAPNRSVTESAAGLADSLGAGDVPAHWFGYSMGGRIALRVALDRPGCVRSLVLLGATAGIEDPGERAARRRADEQRALHLESVGVAEFCRDWLAAPMFAGLPDWAHVTAERRANTVDGLAGSLRNSGTGAMDPVWERLAELRVPVLLLAGALDEKFADTARRMAGSIGDNAEARTVQGAGHAAHLERPAGVVALVEEFLARTGD